MPKEKKVNRKNQFVKGTSGNPAGRPLGSLNQSTLLTQSLLEGEREQITRKLIDLALGGNLHAIDLCMARLNPPGRDRLVCFDMPPLQNVGDVSAGIASILTAVSTGKITPQEGETVSRILSEHGNVMHARDTASRLKKYDAEMHQLTSEDATETEEPETPTVQ